VPSRTTGIRRQQGDFFPTSTESNSLDRGGRHALETRPRYERFSELYWKLRPPYDRGDIDGPAYWTAVVGQQELGLSRDQITTLVKLDSRRAPARVQCLVRELRSRDSINFKVTLSDALVKPNPTPASIFNSLVA
jgi:hypothetical protein